MMEKFILYEKLSKKEKRKIDQVRRQQSVQQKENTGMEAGTTAECL